MPDASMNVALIGFGAMGQRLCELLLRHAPQIRVVGVLTRGEPSAAATGLLPASTTLASTLDELLALRPKVVVECAGHVALRAHGPAVLASGTDLLIASVGALADAEFEARLAASARAGGAALRIAPGALGGLDVLAAARFAGLRSVVYTSRKAVAAWRGTAAEGMIDLERIDGPSVFFEGTARQAASAFPQNANVAAAVALAGAGFEETRVRLVADPGATGNRHDIEARGDFGAIDVSVTGQVLADNPKTSVLAAHSLMRSLVNLSSAVVIG
jgi:aspartate dehydrogenase